MQHCSLMSLDPSGTYSGEVWLGQIKFLVLEFLKNLHIDVHSGGTSSHSHQHWKRVPFRLQPHQHLWCFMSLTMPIPTGVQCNFRVVLSCISPMSNEHYFIKLEAICTSLSIKCVFMLITNFYWVLYFGRGLF